MQKKGKMKMTGMGRGYSPQNTGPATSGPPGQGPQNQGPGGAPGMGSMPNPQNPNMMPPGGPGGNAQASGGPMMGPNVPQSQGMPPTGPNMGPGPGGMGTNVSQSPGIGPSGPVMGPQGMRNQDRPGMPMGPQMQHGQPMQRQYGSGPQQGYQGSGPRAPYPNTNMPGTPPQGQGMHSRVHQSMPPPPNPYPGRMPHQGSMGMDSRKRPAPEGRAAGGPPSKGVRTTSRMPIPQQGQTLGPGGVTHPTGPGVGTTTSGPQTTVSSAGSKKKKKMSEKILPQKVRDLVPESQAYMDLLAFERKLDFTIMRKRLDIQEALKRPMKQKRKLRIFISNTFYPGKPEMDGTEEPTVPSWELRVEGRLLDDPSAPKADQSKGKRKFSSFFKSLVIELDKDLYGPDNHLVEWHRTPTTTETDGFQVKRPGDKNVRCTILLLLDYQPLQFKLDPRLARLLGIHTQTRPMIISALWQYIKTHKLQDPHEREYVNCDKYLEQIFQCQRMKFAEVPQRLHQLLHPPDPIVINHTISNYSVEGPDTKKTACYDIDVEVDDALKVQMNNFLLCTSSQQEIQSLDNKIHETVETINQLKTNREFFLSFAKDPQQFIDKWLMSQTRDLKTITDVVGNPEEERKSDFYYQTWAQEAVCRYFYGKVQQRRAELEQALGIRNT